MVILIRSKDINSDSRVLKYITYLRESNIDYRIISWDRVEDRRFDDKTINFNLKSSYNKGGWRAVKDRIKWMKFVVTTLKNIIKDDTAIIHACDLDTAFPAAYYKKISNKKVKIIFDIFDWFSATLYNQNKIIKSSFALMEKFSIKNSDYIIICEPERIAQIPYHIEQNKLFVLPNIPSFKSADFLSKDKKFEFNNDLITVTYVGGLYEQRCLDEIITIAEKGFINLLIAGYGDKRLENRLTNTHNNIKYFGKVKYEQGLNIMYNADIIYAMYSKTNPNHLFAAPNKYYEAMFLGKPILSTTGINMEEKILKNSMGYTTEEDISSIEFRINSLSKEDLKSKGLKAHELWTKQYATFTQDFLNNEYSSMISSHN